MGGKTMSNPHIINTGLGYAIRIGRGLTEAAADIISGENVFAVVDRKVYKLYGTALGLDRLGGRLYVFKGGEGAKTLDTVAEINRRMLKCGANRRTTLVAVGGGVTGDVAGFAAAVYMRGVKVIQIPTTLLACVDSSIGGKTGVNLGGVKNITGAFHQPSEILINVDFLSTLPYREIRCGLGEIIKTALLDSAVFEYVNAHIKELTAAEPEALSTVIRLCAEFKDRITSEDEKESGLRKILNLGHTVGHGLEAMDGHRLSHGEYVLAGLAIESRIAYESGITDKEYYEVVSKLLGMVKVPKVKVGNVDKLIAYMTSDKKNTDEKIDFVFAAGGIGVTEGGKLGVNELRQALSRII